MESCNHHSLAGVATSLPRPTGRCVSTGSQLTSHDNIHRFLGSNEPSSTGVRKSSVLVLRDRNAVTRGLSPECFGLCRRYRAVLGLFLEAAT